MPGFELFGDKERKEVNEVLETGILMRYGFEGARRERWKAKELELEICRTLGAKHAQLVSSGTAALTTALAALGVGAGDEVIMPVFTFVASFESVLSVGASPVLVDVDETLTISPSAVRAAITPATKCVMPVHMCGAMADLDALQQLCKEHNLLLLEDACQSIGAKYKGKYAGTVGDAGALSFDFVKLVTCAEGGAAITNSDETYIKLDGYSDHGHDHKGADRGLDEHPFMGYNFRISELHAAVGLAQIKRLNEFIAIQKKNHAIVKNILATVPQVSFRKILDESGDTCGSVSWFLPSEEKAKAVVAKLKAENILGGNFYWYDNNWHYIRNWHHLKNLSTLNPLSAAQTEALKKIASTSFAASDSLMSRCITTNISLAWTDGQAQQIGERLKAAVQSVL
jgi:8-amino-3,8-dideoxy-alpha-D-manno-octulosonate transaminase